MHRILLLAVAAVLAQACSTSHLHRWHEVSLDAEFTASMEGNEVRDFADYLALEDRLFSQMQDELMASVESIQQHMAKSRLESNA